MEYGIKITIKLIPPWHVSVDPSNTPAHICESTNLFIVFSTFAQFWPLKTNTAEFLSKSEDAPAI